MRTGALALLGLVGPLHGAGQYRPPPADFGAFCGLGPGPGAIVRAPAGNAQRVPADDLAANWERIRRSLREAVGESTYQLWLEPLELEGAEGDALVVGADPNMVGWVSDRFARALERSAQDVLGPAAGVTLVPRGTGAPARAERRAEREASSPAAAASLAHTGESAARAPAFNPRYTFEQFVIGDANRLAHAAALSVAELPGQAYNPLFLYGAPGLGKTHVLHAIGNYLEQHDPAMRVRYTTVEAFTNHFVLSLQQRGLEAFKASYRDVDVLLIDDVQFLAAKARTEEEFFHTFDQLYEAGAQLVLTSDRLPGDLDALEDRLRERFAAGLVTDLGAPDLPVRLAILAKRIAHDGIPLADDSALLRIAERIEGDVRTLEGALIRVVAYHSLTRRPIDSALVDEVLGGLYPATRPPRRSVADVRKAVAAAFDVTEEELCSPTRASRVAWPRQVGMYLAREHTEASLPLIGREFGGRNHTTVLHACKRISERIATDRSAFDAVHNVSEDLSRP